MYTLPVKQNEMAILADTVRDFGHESLATGLEELHRYSWRSHWRFERAMQSLTVAANAAVAGLSQQTMIRIRDFAEFFSFDVSCQLVLVGRQLGLPVKFFAKLRGDETRITGPEHDWSIIYEEDYNQRIPDEVINGVATLSRHLGLTLAPLSVAVPVPKPAKPKREVKDPVILLHRGPFLLELGRWD